MFPSVKFAKIMLAKIMQVYPFTLIMFQADQYLCYAKLIDEVDEAYLGMSVSFVFLLKQLKSSQAYEILSILER